MQIEIRDELLSELAYLIELNREYGPADYFTNVEGLINAIIRTVADGSRRPGSWERQYLQSMGLVADCEEHQQYRDYYGKPKA